MPNHEAGQTDIRLGAESFVEAVSATGFVIVPDFFIGLILVVELVEVGNFLNTFGNMLRVR